MYDDGLDFIYFQKYANYFKYFSKNINKIKDEEKKIVTIGNIVLIHCARTDHFLV